MWFCATHSGPWLSTISAPERRKVSLGQAPRWVPAPLSSLINSRWQGSWLSLSEWHVWRKNCWAPWKPVGWLWWLRHRSHPPPSDCGRWRREQRDLCSPCQPCPPCCLPGSHRTPGGMTLWACLPSQCHLPTLASFPELGYSKPLQRLMKSPEPAFCPDLSPGILSSGEPSLMPPGPVKASLVWVSLALCPLPYGTAQT